MKFETGQNLLYTSTKNSNMYSPVVCVYTEAIVYSTELRFKTWVRLV